MFFKRDVKWNPEVVLGTGFGGICNRYLRLNCPKPVPGEAQDRLDFVCVSVCVRVCLFALFLDPFFDDFLAEFICNFMKRALKKWVLQPISVGEAGHFRGHLAEVVALSSSGDCGATLPLGLFGGVAVGDLHLWRHLPPRVQF